MTPDYDTPCTSTYLSTPCALNLGHSAMHRNRLGLYDSGLIAWTDGVADEVQHLDGAA